MNHKTKQCPKCEGSGQTAICPGHIPDEVKKGIASGMRIPIRHTCGNCNGSGEVEDEIPNH